MRELNPDPEFDRAVLPALISYRDAVPGAFVPPALREMRARAQRRAVVRGTALTTATAAAAVAAGVAVAILPGIRDTTRPPIGPPSSAPANQSTPTPATPAPSTLAPSPTGAPTAAQSMPGTWGGQTVVLPAQSGYRPCPEGRVTFATGGETVVDNIRILFSDTMATGDLTGDGQPEAVAYMHCVETSEFASGDGSGHMMVITRDSAGMLRGLAHVGPDGEEYPKARVRDGVLVATIQQRYGTAVQERIYRWDGTSFKQIGGPTALPSN